MRQNQRNPSKILLHTPAISITQDNSALNFSLAEIALFLFKFQTGHKFFTGQPLLITTGIFNS